MLLVEFILRGEISRVLFFFTDSFCCNALCALFQGRVLVLLRCFLCTCSQFQIGLGLGISFLILVWLSPWISVGFRTLISDEPQHLWMGGMYSNSRQGRKIEFLLGKLRAFWTLAEWKTGGAVKMVCMAMMLSWEKGRFEPWRFNHLTNLPFKKPGLKIPKLISSVCSEIYLLKGCIICSTMSCSAAVEKLYSF